jgi:uncharacterized membrane protein YbhN (UPF0104 family)
VRRRWVVRIAAAVGSLAAAVALLALALPAIVSAGWSAIAEQLEALPTWTLPGLAALWFAGLWTYTFVLTGSLPGLRHTQALVLNFAGSGISNLVPFGGAAGVAITFAMAGSWGHPRRQVAVSTVVSGAWNVLSRLALPALGLAVLIASGRLPDRRIMIAATVTTVVLACSVALGVAILIGDGRSRWVLRVSHRLGPALPAPALVGLRRIGNALSQLRRGAVEVIRREWLRLTLGMFGYLGMQYLLFWACLTATSTHVSAAVAVAAFALSRLLATVPVTPGGIGVTESGTAALLVAMGAAGAPVAAALLLFGLFTHAAEIPIGGLAWITWAAAKRWRQNEQVPGRNAEPSGDDLETSD